MFIKILLTIIFLCVTVAVGIYSRKQASSVEGFVLGGRTVGPWLTAFAFGTSYFSAVVFVGYGGQFGWKYGSKAVPCLISLAPAMPMNGFASQPPSLLSYF